VAQPAIVETAGCDATVAVFGVCTMRFTALCIKHTRLCLVFVVCYILVRRRAGKGAAAMPADIACGMFNELICMSGLLPAGMSTAGGIAVTLPACRIQVGPLCPEYWHTLCGMYGTGSVPQVKILACRACFTGSRLSGAARRNKLFA
jgi:hypothetical protein